MAHPTRADQVLQSLAVQPVYDSFPEVARAIRSQTERIIEDCRKIVFKAIPKLNALTVTEFEDDLASILRRLAHALESDDPNEVRGLLESAPEHGINRCRLQFELLDLLQESRILRGVIVVRLEDELGRVCTVAEAASLHAMFDLMSQQSVLSMVDEQKEHLRESEERYRLLVSHATVGVAHVELDGTITFANQHFCKMTGYSADELRGRRFQEITHPEDRPRDNELFDRLVKTGEPFVIEKRYIRKDGRTVWVSTSGGSMGLADGKPTSLVAVAIDITDRKAAEQALADENAAHKRLHEISCRLIPTENVKALYGELIDAAIEITQADRGTMQQLDPETGELCLLQTRQMPQSVWDEFARITPESLTSCGIALRRGERTIVDYVADEQVAGTKEAQAHLDAGIRMAQSTPLVTRSGEVVGMLSTHWSEPRTLLEPQLRLLDVLARQAADLIDRARTDEAVRAREAHLAAIFARAAVGIAEVSPEGRFLHVNDELCRILGRSRQWMLAADVQDVTHPDDLPASMQAITQLLETGEPISIDKRYVCADGKEVFANSVLSRLDNDRGRPQSILAVTVDLSERKRAEEALRESRERLKLAIEAGHLGDWSLDLTTGNASTSFRHDQCFGATEPFKDWSFETFLSHVHPEDRPEVQRQFNAAVTTRGDWHTECRVIWPDGSIRWIEAQGTHYLDATGQARRMLGIVREITERKRAEEELRYRSEQFEQLLNQAPFGVYVIDAEFRLMQVNPEARPVFGDMTDLIGRDFSEVLYAMWQRDHADEIIGVFRRTLDTGAAFHFPEFAQQRADRGVTEYYDWRIERIVLPEGRFGVACYFRDISEQVRARQAISESEARYRTLFESIDEGFCIIEMIFDDDVKPVDYRFLEVNPAFEKHAALRDAIGKRMRELAPTHEEYWFEIYGKVALTGEPTRFVDRAEALGRWFDVYAFRVGEPHERKVAVLFSDITHRKETEAAQRESEERLRIAKAAAQLGLHDYNVPAGTVEWDERTRELFSVGKDEPITYELWRDALHPDDREQAETAVKRALDPAGNGQYFAQYRVIDRNDGAMRWLEATGQATFVDGRPLRLIGTVQDVTARKRAEDALREADRRKDEFLATLAHELRNPLAPIRMAVNVLKTVREDPERFEEMADVIARQSNTMSRLIDDLLDVSRITRGKISLRKKPIDLASLIAHAAETIHPLCDSKNLRLTTVLPEKPVTIEGDPVRLGQVINNLLSNACKFTRQGGRIRIAAGRENEHAVIRVTDTGIGIAPEDRERIFEMFTQVEQAGRRTSAGGLGIGLKLARSLVQMHGGDITVDSEPGKGSEFIVHLPVTHLAESQEPIDAAAPADAGPHATLENKPARNILIVDDNLDALRAVETLLHSNGHTVHTAATGERAYQLAEQTRPEVVVLDIGLPDIDGYEVARRIRRQQWGKDIHLIAMTGWGQPRDKQRAEEAGFNRHLTKPADPELLEQLIEEPTMSA